MSVFDTKNPSPRTLYFFSALLLSTLNAVLSLTIVSAWYISLIVFGITFLITYFLYYYTLQRFIYRKIKLIYKFIYQTKATKKEEFFYENVLPEKSIEEVSRDVQKWATKRREEISVLRANEQFRKEFLMNLAHELRTPIFTVQGYIETLLEGAIDDPGVNKKFLNNASKGVERLVRLVDDLNEISQLESKKTPITQERFIIQDLISDVFEELSLNAKDKNMTLTFNLQTNQRSNRCW
jgi:two-component system, OmpR family, phosphate regulon sensor histidine kinase PhoR